MTQKTNTIITAARYLHPRAIIAATKRRLWRFTDPEAPWLPREVVQFLDSWLTPAHLGLEWGSGRSTLWLARRTATDDRRRDHSAHKSCGAHEPLFRGRPSGWLIGNYRRCGDG